MGKHRTKAPGYIKTTRRSRIEAMLVQGYVHVGAERFGKLKKERQ